MERFYRLKVASPGNWSAEQRPSVGGRTMHLNSEANATIGWRNAFDALDHASTALLSENGRALATRKEALGKGVRRFRTAGGICCERGP